ncbi:MAG: hypothetical protein AAFX85_10360, partial [Pseudomonadota bacterium]
LNEALALDCDAPGGERRLLWVNDDPGAGEGEIGVGDGFEQRFENCFDATLDRFVEGVITLDEYQPIDEDAREASLGGEIDFLSFFIAEQEVDIDTLPSTTSPRLTGRLTLLYEEVEIEEPAEETQ